MKPLSRKTDNAGMTALATVYCGWAITSFPDFVNMEEIIAHVEVACRFLNADASLTPQETQFTTKYAYELMQRINDDMDAKFGGSNV